MIKYTTFLVLISSAILLFQKQEIAANPENASQNQDTMKFEHVFILGLQGNISSALSFLDTLENGILTERQDRIKKNYYARFRDKDENYSFIPGDPGIISLMKIYHEYWRDALLDNASLSRYDSVLTSKVTEFLKENYAIVKNKSKQDLNENFPQYLQDYLKSKEIYAATGKTGMFFDLLMHAKETEVLYEVNTPEDTIKLKVIFMENIISNGWEDYATFGKYYPGGWTTSDALYCIKESYDLESENFNVSYLKHEGKHFADYKSFPRLGGADLEYRAKLVELSFAEKSMYKLIQFFIKNSKYDRNNPHSYANYCVIRDLSELIFNNEFITDMDKWKSADISIINENAIKLLKKNTEDLKKAGAETVTDFIK